MKCDAVQMGLPPVRAIEEKPCPVEFPGWKGRYDVQLKRELSQKSEASEERWVLKGDGSGFIAETVAKVKPDGIAVTGQWRLGDKYFTLVIVRCDDSLKGFLLGQAAEERNISRMPSTVKDDEVSVRYNWTTITKYLDVPRNFPIGPCYIENQCDLSNWSLYSAEAPVHVSSTGKLHDD